MEQKKNILFFFEEAGLKVCFRESERLEWDKVLENSDYFSVNYLSGMIDYQIEYCRGNKKNDIDISLLLIYNNQYCGVWPLSLAVGEKNPMRSNGGMILPPVFISKFPLKSRKKVVKICLNFLNVALHFYKGQFWNGLESFQNCIGLSVWHKAMLEKVKSINVKHELYVDLSLSLPSIKSKIRKSYKSLIVSGLRHYNVAILDCENVLIWDEFRRLHRKVSGRVTRSIESWDLLHYSIKTGDAFLVYLQDSNGSMVGGGFFYITTGEGAYSVGAYDRNLFDKPLGHLVQYRAIEEMKKRGLKWYLIGERQYSFDIPAPSQKEISISNFKQGFSTHTFSKYILNHEI
jgi:FemAB family protein